MPSGLSFVNETLLRGAETMRVTISGGLVYFSFARTSFGFHPCCITFCAASGAATRSKPVVPMVALSALRATTPALEEEIVIATP